jgi:hypothetical protein
MDCRQAKELVSAYIDGMLDTPVRESLERHLAQCAGCREEYEKTREMAKQVGALNTLETPPDFFDALHERIRMEKTESKLKKLERSLFFPLQVKIPLEIAGLAAVIVLIFSFYQVTEPERYLPSAARVSAEKMASPEQTAAPESHPAMGGTAQSGPARNKSSSPEAASHPEAVELLEKPDGPLEKTKKTTGYESRTVELTLVVHAPETSSGERPAAETPAPVRQEMKEKDSAGLMKAAPDAVSASNEESQQVDRKRENIAAERKGRDDELTSRVRDVIVSVQGTLVSVENDERGRPRLIKATVSGNRLQELCRRLENIAELQPSPRSIAHSGQEEVPVRVLIRIEEKD